jgi:hypothetical protein
MLKLIAFVALFAGVCWFGTTVPLGAHTLFGHLHAIAGTRESQELLDGTRQSARPLVDDMRRRIAGVPAPSDAPEREKGRAARPEPETETGESARAMAKAPVDAGPPRETVTASERRRLRKLISSAESAPARR